MNPILWGYVGLGAVLLGSLAYGQYERGNRIYAQAETEKVSDQLRLVQATLDDTKRDRDSVVAALGHVSQAIQSSTQNLQPARSAAYAAPRSNACVQHPGVRSLRDSLRARQIGAPGNLPARPQQPS
jgi:hypothetical protein